MKTLQEYEWLVAIIGTLLSGKYYWSAVANDCDVKLVCRLLKSKQSTIANWKRFAKRNKITDFTIFENAELE